MTSRSWWKLRRLHSEPPPWSQHPSKFSSYKSCENEDIILSIIHMTRSSDFKGGSLSPYVKKILDPQNTHAKNFWTHEIFRRKNFGPAKFPREKKLDPWNTHEKKFWTHEIHTRKNYTHEGTMARWHGTHETHHGTRSTKLAYLIMRCP